MFTVQKYKNKRLLLTYNDELTTKLKNKFARAFKPFHARWSSQNNGWLCPNYFLNDIQQALSSSSDPSDDTLRSDKLHSNAIGEVAQHSSKHRKRHDTDDEDDEERVVTQKRHRKRHETDDEEEEEPRRKRTRHETESEDEEERVPQKKRNKTSGQLMKRKNDDFDSDEEEKEKEFRKYFKTQNLDVHDDETEDSSEEQVKFASVKHARNEKNERKSKVSQKQKQEEEEEEEDDDMLIKLLQKRKNKEDVSKKLHAPKKYKLEKEETFLDRIKELNRKKR